MIVNIFRMIVLGVALSLSASAYNGGDKKTGVVDECKATKDLRITTSSVDIDRRGESEIKGQIVNDARRADYKDVRVRINFLDGDGDQIGSRIETVKGDFNDGSSEDFIIKFEAPRGTEQASYAVECAIKD